ncbi:36398_t:CDS:2 [Gigaspora margarita]|uniref:36398_t:CDS:1 n=1 Tax=Gigaspora margarita TaxID=4874 RepID=A0ABN7VNK1_GIGMA|nr:36398_t:CDS:2 [Gigaspora margarita]
MNEFENYDDSINMEETSSHTEIIEDSLQEYNEITTNIVCQRDNNNNSDSSNQSDKNNNSDQNEYDIYEEIDEETDNEDYKRITLSSSLNVNSRLLDILPKLSYNSVQLLYNLPLLTENHPQIIYPYQSIITRIASILVDKSNERLIDSPFKRQIEKGMLDDIYDGKVWQEFLDKQGQPFFVGNKADARIGLAFNLDWYTPYSRVKRSCAPIYITILNFPRHIRYRSENFILAGIIPGPKEPDTSQLQNYFQPIVNELKQLWSGQLIKTTLYPVGCMFHCALIKISYDIPAAHKD